MAAGCASIAGGDVFFCFFFAGRSSTVAALAVFCLEAFFAVVFDAGEAAVLLVVAFFAAFFAAALAGAMDAVFETAFFFAATFLVATAFFFAAFFATFFLAAFADGAFFFSSSLIEKFDCAARF